MFFALPIRDEPRVPFRPIATYALIAVQVLLHLLVSWPLMGQPAAPDDPSLPATLRLLHELHATSGGLGPGAPTAFDLFVHRWGFRSDAPSLLTAITYMFLHGSVMHVLGNMLFLWLVGHTLEHRMGRPLFLLAFVVTGAAAAGVYQVFAESAAPMVGASGAVFGLLGCYFLWFPRHRVVLLVVWLWFVRTVRMPARWVLGVYVLVADLLPFVLSTDSNVAHSAHIGGFLAGLVLAQVGDHLAPRGAARRAAAEGTPAAASPELAFAQAAARRQWEAALETYLAMSHEQRHHLPGAPLFGLAEWLLSHHGRPHDALAVLQRFIATHPTSAELAEAHLRAGLLHLRALDQRAAAYQHMLSVLDLTPTDDQRGVARAVLHELERSP